MNTTLTLANGSDKVDISSLEAGVYMFNVALESGQSSSFSVVKQ